MNYEERLVLVILLCAALIGAAVMLRDAHLVGLAVNEDSPPMELPDLELEPMAQQAHALWTTCTILPSVIDGSLILLALVVFIHLIITAMKKSGRYWRFVLDGVLIIVLGLLIAQYIACRAFFPAQYLVFLILLLIVVLIRVVDHLKPRPATFNEPAKQGVFAHIIAKSPAIKPKTLAQLPPPPKLADFIGKLKKQKAARPSLPKLPTPSRPLSVLTPTLAMPKPTKRFWNIFKARKVKPAQTYKISSDLAEVFTTINRSKKTTDSFKETLQKLKSKKH